MSEETAPDRVIGERSSLAWTMLFTRKGYALAMAKMYPEYPMQRDAPESSITGIAGIKLLSPVPMRRLIVGNIGWIGISSWGLLWDAFRTVIIPKRTKVLLLAEFLDSEDFPGDMILMIRAVFCSGLADDAVIALIIWALSWVPPALVVLARGFP